MELPPILDVARRAGLQPKRLGASDEYVIPCPWRSDHSNGDEHPSCRLNPEKNTFFCDPCGEGGGVVTFAVAFGIDPLSMRGRSGYKPRQTTKTSKRPLSFTPEGPVTPSTRLHFATALRKDYPLETWAAFGVKEGHVGQHAAVAFPLLSGGWKACLYKRPDRKRGKPYTFWFCDGGGGDLVVVGQGQRVLLCAGEWDAMAAYAAGVPCVATTSTGEGSWRDEWSETLRGKEVIVAYDVDEAGRNGAESIAAKLVGIADRIWILRLPLSGDVESDGKDLSDYLAVHGSEDFHELLNVTVTSTPAVEQPEAATHASPYETLTQLLDALPADSGDEASLELLHTLVPLLRGCAPIERDLGMKRIKKQLKVAVGALREELKLAGSAPDVSEEEETEQPEPTEEQRALLEDADLLGRFKTDIKATGLVGEENNAIIVLLVVVSARMADPLSLASKGESSAGKNFLIKSVCKLVPKSWIVDVSSLSPQALAYWQGDLKHRVLVITEVVGAERADYQIRILQSEGEIRVYYVTKVDGELRTVEKQVAGPTAMITTTTRSNLHPENETRLLEIAPDESEEQTLRIHRGQAQQKSSPADVTAVHLLQEFWQGALSALKPVQVRIPFAPFIEFPTKQVRSRRDFPKLLALVEALAFLHQYQRDRDHERENLIVASIADYAVAYELIGAFFRQLNSGLNQTTSQVLAALLKDPIRRWKAREMSTHLGWSPESGPKKAKRTFQRLLDLGLADADDPVAGKATLYWPLESTEKSGVGLTTPEDLALRWQAQGGHLDIAWSRWMSRSKSMKEG